MLLNLQISSDDINILTDTFDLDSKVLKTDIDLLKHTNDVSNDGIINIDKLIKGQLNLIVEEKLYILIFLNLSKYLWLFHLQVVLVKEFFQNSS
jgi:hypothetical protein